MLGVIFLAATRDDERLPKNAFEFVDLGDETNLFSQTRHASACRAETWTGERGFGRPRLIAVVDPGMEPRGCEE